MTVNFDGQPERVDPDPNFWLNYAVYEATYGVVVMVYDVNHNYAADIGEPVEGVIVNNEIVTYQGTTADGIGVGSPLSDVISAYGQPDSSFYDDDPIKPADVYFYFSMGLTFFMDPTDSVTFEIHLTDPSAARASSLDNLSRGRRVNSSAIEGTRAYRLIDLRR
jgi:hypothetical protein